MGKNFVAITAIFSLPHQQQSEIKTESHIIIIIRIRSDFSKHFTIKNCDKIFQSILRKLKVC